MQCIKEGNRVTRETSEDVVIIGRNEILREGLRRILADQGFSVIAAVSEHQSFIGNAGSTPPQLMIVDAETVDEGIDICALLREAYPEPRIVMIGDRHDLETIARAFAVGIDGYLVKAIACDALVGSLRLIMLGEKVVPSKTLEALTDGRPVDHVRSGNGHETNLGLTDREIEILGRLVEGDPNKVISRRLLITEATVKVHIKAILRKLNVINRTQAAIWAVDHGMFGNKSSSHPGEGRRGTDIADVGADLDGDEPVARRSAGDDIGVGRVTAGAKFRQLEACLT